MLRFILNFFLFGILFYLIYLFFPDTFQTLVSWANNVYTFFHGLYLSIVEKTSTTPKPPAHEVEEAAPKAILLVPILWHYIRRWM